MKFAAIAVLVAILPSVALAQSAYDSSYGKPRHTNPAYQSSYGQSGDVQVSGYQRQNGTYVQPYERTRANNTRSDNYSTKGNVNPYTGQPGTQEPDQNAY